MDNQKERWNQHLLERMECTQADVLCICIWYLRAACISSSSRRNMLDRGNPTALGEGLGGRMHWLNWSGSATRNVGIMTDSVAPKSRLMSMCSVRVAQACVQNLELWAFDKASGPQVVCGETWPNHFGLHPKPSSLALEKQLTWHYIGIQFFSSFGRICFEVKQNPRTDSNHILFPSEFQVLSESCPKFQSWGLWCLSKKRMRGSHRAMDTSTMMRCLCGTNCTCLVRFLWKSTLHSIWEKLAFVDLCSNNSEVARVKTCAGSSH